MPSAGKRKPSPASIRQAFKTDLADAWAAARAKHPDQTPYAFVLYDFEGAERPRLTPCVMTEEGLTRVATRYVDDGYHDTLDEARAALRYSVGDAPFLEELYDRVPSVEAIIDEHPDALNIESGYDLLAKGAIAALGELDGDGLFGSGSARERLLLMIVLEGADKDWTNESVRKLNPRPAVDRFEAETKIEGAYASSQSIAIAPDGLSIYSAGSRNIEGKRSGEGESLSGVVAYAVRGRKLVQRWVFEFPGFGDSIRDVASTPDGQAVLALRVTYLDAGCQSTLLRFPHDSNVPTHQRTFNGQAMFALSKDGSRIAVMAGDKTLHILNANLDPLSTRTIEAKVNVPMFIGAGDLLLPSESGLLRLNIDDDEPPTAISPLRSFRLAMNAAQSVLAVSRWFAMQGKERLNPTEFPIHVLSLPSFQTLRTFLIPGHQAVTPAISPDGRLLAFEVHEVGKPRTFIVVFEISTGREIARRKSDFVSAMEFLPDGKTLAITAHGFTKTAPIDLWTLPVSAD